MHLEIMATKNSRTNVHTKASGKGVWGTKAIQQMIRQGRDGCRVQTRIHHQPGNSENSEGKGIIRAVKRLMSSAALMKSKTTPTTILQVEKE